MGIKPLYFICGLVLSQSLSAQNIIPQSPVEPSPWWIIDRFGQNLVTNTTIDRDNQRLVLTIDNGVWSNLDYLGRTASSTTWEQAPYPTLQPSFTNPTPKDRGDPQQHHK